MYFMEDNDILTIEKDGVEVKCDICFSYICENNLKGYIVFTDHSKDSNNKENLYVRSYDPNDEEINLKEVSDEEYEMTIEAMNKIQNNS